MKTFKQFNEEMAMSATGVSGGGPIAGAPPDFPPVPAGVTTKGHMLRRRPLNKTVDFKVYLRHGKKK